MRTPEFSGTSISVASHRIGENTTKSRTVSLNPTKVPRPPNAFILYRQRHHPRVKETYPDLSNNEICKFSVIRKCITDQLNEHSSGDFRKAMESGT
jgi:hypothetical protein